MTSQSYADRVGRRRRSIDNAENRNWGKEHDERDRGEGTGSDKNGLDVRANHL
jgi:hypothetical protein